MVSKLRTTILCMCAVLLLVVLAMPQSAEAQAGWNVTRSAEVNTLIFGGNNQQVSHVTFVNQDKPEDNPVIVKRSDGDTTITVTYGDLMITNATRDTQTLTSKNGDPPTDNFDLWCSSDFGAACSGDDQPRATIANDDDGKGSVTITIPTAFNASFRLAYVRLDVSGLENEAEVPISIKRGADATVPLGGGTGSGAVSGVVGKIAMGLKVTADPKAGLACGADVFPTVTVAEGFKGAWAQASTDEDPGQPATNVVQVKIAVGNFPDGGEIEWPSPVNATADDDSDDATAEVTVGTLTLVTADSKENGQTVVYSYKPDMAVTGTGARPAHDPDNTFIRSFGITPTKVEITGDQTLSVTAMLYPMADMDAQGDKSNLSSVLSFDVAPVAPEEGKGEEWLVLSECVTYLLYPFITCGATAGWSTGISVSNTSADGNVFGAFDEANEQSGSVVMYGFPQGRGAPAEGESVEPVVSTLSTNLAAGDTVVAECSSTTMAGMQGYAIIRAGFQHARGMAFVLGNFADGAGVDVSHGYMAEVITNPADRSETIP